MHLRILQFLRCPLHGVALTAESFKDVGSARIYDGLLHCAREHSYWIVRGIPRFVAGHLYDTGTFKSAYQSRLSSRDLESRPPGLDEAKAATSTFFGNEWKIWSRYGWDDPSFAGSPEERVFRQKTLLEPQDIKQATVLDAGCGNGRYSLIAAQSAASQVVAIDFSGAVDVAYRNLANCPNVDVVQADVFNPPFATDYFDIVFSIGVLHHTGNTPGAITSLARLIKPTGTLSVELYQRGNVVYEAIDFGLRGITTRMRPTTLWATARVAGAISAALYRAKLLDLVNIFARLGPNAHTIFDWYGAPVATHHNIQQVRGWFKDSDISVVATSDKERGTFGNIVRKYLYPTEGITVRGRRSDNLALVKR